MDDALFGSGGHITKVLLFDWETEIEVDELCQCAEVALVLLSGNDSSVTELCHATTSSSNGCSVGCTNDMQCSFDRCDSTGMNKEVCVLYNSMLLPVQIKAEVVELFFISKGVPCYGLGDFNQEICATHLHHLPGET